MALLVLFPWQMVHIALQLHGKLDFLICPSYAENNDTLTEMMKPRCAIFGQEAQGAS